MLSHIRYLALLLLAGSQTLVLQWLLLAWTGEPLSLLAALGALLVLAAVNVGAMFLMMRIARRTRAAFIFSRVWMLGSLGALFSGPPLVAVFVTFGGLAWLTSGLGEAAARAGQLALLGGGGAAVGLGFGSIAWGYLIGQRRVQVERVDIPLRGVNAAQSGIRLAHVTDLHIGPQLRAPQLAGFVDRINGLEPDLIVITGDIFDFDPEYIEEGCRELSKLHAPCGVFAVLGNHDVYTGADAVAIGLAQYTKIELLRDDWRTVQVNGASLVIAGIEDPGRGWVEKDSQTPQMDRLAAEIPDGVPRVLLIHRPSFFAQASRLGFPLSLAGHTHGGQISLPPPAHHHNISRLISHWTRGLFEDETGESLLYVSRGLGVAGPPVRLNCSREIALLRLVEGK